MSTLDGVSSASDYVATAEAYGLSSITITDHNSTQSFPDAYNAFKKSPVKVNYGVEFDVYDDVFSEIVINGDKETELISAEYVVFDLETTSVSALSGEIIEFGAVKYKENMVIERKQMFFKPSSPISEFTTSLTGISNEDVENAPLLSDVIAEIKE
jgi:DNA polymerase-3 subunit alpha (Gram-positive type)